MTAESEKNRVVNPDASPEAERETPGDWEPILQFFQYAHLPAHLQEVSWEFYDLAGWIYRHLPRNPERTVALRKLLEAKDAAVRARLFKGPDS